MDGWTASTLSPMAGFVKLSRRTRQRATHEGEARTHALPTKGVGPSVVLVLTSAGTSIPAADACFRTLIPGKQRIELPGQRESVDVLGCVVLDQKKDDHCWPSVKRIVDDTGAGERAIRRRLRELREPSFLMGTHRWGRSIASALGRREGDADCVQVVDQEALERGATAWMALCVARCGARCEGRSCCCVPGPPDQTMDCLRTWGLAQPAHSVGSGDQVAQRS